MTKLNLRKSPATYVAASVFVNKKVFKDPVVPELAPFPIKGLDYPNNHYKEDYVLDWWCTGRMT